MRNTSNSVVVDTTLEINDDEIHEKPHKPTNGDGAPAPNERQNSLFDRCMKCPGWFKKRLCPERQDSLFDRCMKCPGWFKKRLRPNFKKSLCPFFSKELPPMKKDEATAYKMLMDDLESAPKEHPWSVILITLRVFALMTFISIFVTTLFVPKIKRSELLKLRPSRWVALLMVAVSGLPCIRFVTLLVSEPVLWIVWLWKMRKYDMFFVRQLKRSFDVTLWFGLLLWVWFAWFSDEITHDIKGAKTLEISKDKYKHVLTVASSQITRLLLALTLGSALWVLKSFVYLKLEADLLYKRLCPRIRNSILDLYRIQLITHDSKEKWSLLEKKNKGRGKNRNNRVETNEENVPKTRTMSFWMAISHLKRETAPIWILKKLTYTFTELMKRDKPTVLARLEDTNDDEKHMKEAEVMYQQVVGKEDEGVITQVHLRKYGLQKEELTYVFRLSKTDEDVKEEEMIITRDQFLRWAVQAFRGILALESTVANSKHIFMKLKALMSAGVVALAIVIWLLLSKLVTTSQLAILLTPFLSAGFIFGDSLKRVFDGVVFVFGMHPFDVGDRVIVDNNKMRVNELKLLTTTFFVYDTGNEIIYPNYDLGSKSIVNLDVEKNMSDSVEFNIPIDTPEELFLDLQIRLKKSLDDEIAFTSDTVVVKSKIVDKNVVVIVYFKYLVAYHSAETKAFHMSKVINTIVRLLGELDKAKGSESKEEEYKSEIVKFKIDSKVKLAKIEDLNNEILSILRKYQSFKDKSRVIFACIDKDSVTIDVQMRYREDDLVKNHDDKEKIKREVVDAIQAKKGEVIDSEANPCA